MINFERMAYMKKMIAIALILVLIIGTVPTFADTNNNKAHAVEVLRAMGVVSGDADGAIRLTQLIRRAEFSQILVNTAGLKNNPIGTLSTSVFADVKYDFWAAGAIRTVTQNGWVSGYLDGTYRPNQFITYEEVAVALLKMLGYNSQDFYGNDPQGAILKFSELELDRGIKRKAGDYINREELLMMVYNMMHTATKTGMLYGETLGYVVPLNYARIVDQHTKGPFVTSTGIIAEQLPFSEKNTIIYRNGRVTSFKTIRPYDVYYYNQNIKTVWVFSQKVTGIYASAMPSIASPTSVIVSGKTYTIGASQAAYKLSNTGSFPLGTAITILLGKNGEIVDVVKPSTTDENAIGVVLEQNTQTYTDGVGKMFVERIIKWVGTDGNVQETAVGNGLFNKGDLVSVSWSTGEPLVKKLSVLALTGKVDASGRQIGNTKVAESVEIIDVTPEGEFASIFTSRLSGTTLMSSDVKYYTKDASGQIDKIILNNLTGDFNAYGLVTDKTEETVVIPSSNPMIPDTVSQTGVYTYSINGVKGVKQTSGSLVAVNIGPAVFTLKDGQVDGFSNLSGFNVSSLTPLSASSGQNTYALAEAVQVYQQMGSAYYLINLETVLHTNDYHLMAYYDSGYRLGGQVRVIVAVKKVQ